MTLILLGLYHPARPPSQRFISIAVKFTNLSVKFTRKQPSTSHTFLYVTMYKIFRSSKLTDEKFFLNI